MKMHRSDRLWKQTVLVYVLKNADTGDKVFQKLKVDEIYSFLSFGTIQI